MGQKEETFMWLKEPICYIFNQHLLINAVQLNLNLDYV